MEHYSFSHHGDEISDPILNSPRLQVTVVMATAATDSLRHYPILSQHPHPSYPPRAPSIPSTNLPHTLPPPTNLTTTLPLLQFFMLNDSTSISLDEVVTPPVSHVATPPVSHVVTPPVSHVVTPPVSHVVTPPVSHVVTPR